MPTFAELASEYESLWARMKIRPERVADVDVIARKLLANKARYQAVASQFGSMPWEFIAALHNRESGADFGTYLGNGEPLDQVTRLVPKGRGPFASWEAGAVDALKLKNYQAITAWPVARVAYEVERFNGFGYRDHHPNVLSPYLWSFTDLYSVGKYAADGQFASTLVDKQCGVMPIIKRIREIEGVKTAPAAVNPGGAAPSGAAVPPSSNWLAAILKALMSMFSHSKPAQPAAPPPPSLIAGTDLSSRIIRAMQRKGYRIDTGPGEVNIVYVEGVDPDGTPNDDAPNQFNDARFVIGFFDGKPKLLGAWEGTTEPSKRWTEQPMNPKGAARIQFGQYLAWQVGIHNGNHEALVQTGGDVTVCRDRNKDYIRTGDELDTGRFGINQHHGYGLPKNDLGTSSAGCLVGRDPAGHRTFMAIVKSDPRYGASKSFVFTTAILADKDIAA